MTTVQNSSWNTPMLQRLPQPMRGTNPFQRDDFVHQQMADLMQQVMKQIQAALQNPNGQNQGPGAQGPGTPGAGEQAPGGTCCTPGGAQGPGAGGQAPGTEGAKPGTGANGCGPSQPESPAAGPTPTPTPGGNGQSDNGCCPPPNQASQRPGNWDHRPYTPPGAGNGNRPTPLPAPWDGQRPSPMPRPTPIRWDHEQAGGRGDSAGRGNAGADRITARESAALRLLARMFARLQ
ncbi:hypothetical protein [Variovorax soli]|uniref:hypothetical protein n=1 Tax=Variovorax soli TaxID=376815 RepID=UPI000B087EEB|nr:hypothetical protein [Variovorax soli]